MTLYRGRTFYVMRSIFRNSIPFVASKWYQTNFITFSSVILSLWMLRQTNFQWPVLAHAFQSINLQTFSFPISRFFERPVYSVEQVIEGEPLPFPAVTICTTRPLKRQKLFNFFTKCDTYKDDNSQRLCNKYQDLLPEVANINDTYFWSKKFSDFLQDVDKPNTFSVTKASNSRNHSLNFNLLNDVSLFTFRLGFNYSMLTSPYTVRHSPRPQCKEYSFTPRFSATTVGKDYTALKVDGDFSLENDSWDDSIYVAIPSGPGDCGRSPCNRFQYQVSLHPPKHPPRHFHEFFKFPNKVSMLGIDSYAERILMPPPYNECTNQWSEEALKLAEAAGTNISLMNDYTMNECIINFKRKGVRCPKKCNQQEYIAGRMWEVKLFPDSIGPLFQFEKHPKEYTSLEIVFTQLKHTKMEQKALCPFVKLLGNIGGLAGLYMGISIVSLVEVAETLLLIIAHICKRLAWSGSAVKTPNANRLWWFWRAVSIHEVSCWSLLSLEFFIVIKY